MTATSTRRTRVLLAAAIAAAVPHALASQLQADPSISYTGGAYTQNFNSLWTPGTADINTPAAASNLEPNLSPIQIGPQTVGSAPINLVGPSADFFTTIPNIANPSTVAGAGMPGWYATSFGGNSVPLNYNVNDGSSNSVALTAYYDPARQTSGNNLALGALTGSASGNIVYGMRLVNNGATTLNAISLSYTGVLFHQDTGSKTLTFGYAVDPTGTANIPIADTTGYSALNVTGFATGTSGAVATTAASTEALSVTNLPLATAWAPGQALWLTWTMNTAGGGQGLAIDDLTFSAATITGAPTLLWNLTNDGNWNQTDANWTGSNTIFTNNNFNVSFGNIAANTTITVDAAGVIVPGSVTIANNNATTYIFAGGSIGGSAALNISGTGTVQLTAANSYGGGTNLNAGTLIIDNNNQLGVTAGALNFKGGTLKLADSLAGGTLNAGARPVTVSAAGGTLNTNGSTMTFTSPATAVIHGVLHVSGGGTLQLVQPTFGSNASPGGSLIIDAGTTVNLVGNGRSSPSDFYSGSVINGTLVISSPTLVGARFNFDSPGTSGPVDHNGDSKITGTGLIKIMNGSGWTDVGTAGTHKWQLDTNGIVISNTSAQYAAEIDVPIYLNPLADSDPVGHPYHGLDVTSANFIGAANPNGTGSFVTILGGTKIGTQGHGPGFSNMKITGVISGNSDISFGNDYKNGGSGDVTLLAQNTWTGVTMINGGGAQYIGVTDALPTTTDIIFGAITGTPGGIIDLSGHDQHVHSIEVAIGTNSPQANIIDNSGTADATLFITGNNTPFYPYNAQLNDGGTATNGTTGTHKLALNKSGSSTLVLGEYLASGHTTTSTYSGGTTIGGGILQIAFDGALGAASGSLTLDGGTLSVQNIFFQGSATELTAALSSDRRLTVTANGGTITTPSFQTTLFNSSTVTMIEPVTFTGLGGYNWASTAAKPLTIDGPTGSNVTINGGAGAVSVTAGATIQINATAKLTVGGASDPFTDSSDNSKHVAILNNGTFSVGAGTTAIAGLSGNGNTTLAPTATLLVTATSGSPGSGTLALNGGTLGGHGTAFAAVSGNGTIAPSIGTAATGTLTLGSLTTNANTTFNFNLVTPNVAAGVGSDTVAATNITLNGGNILFGDTGAAEGYYKVMSYSGTLSGTSVGPNNILTGITMPATANPNDIYVLDTHHNPGFIDIHKVLQGDANADGLVDGFDFNAWFNNLEVSTFAYESGDFNGDGLVDGFDFNIWFNHLETSFQGGTYTSSQLAELANFLTPDQLASLTAGGPGVPEPTSLALLTLATLPLLRRKRRP